MASEKTDAIVVRMIEFSETSLVLTLFSREFGRVSGLAKGARRAKSPFEGSLDLLSICHFEILRKSHDALDLITEAKLSRRFRAAQRSLERLYCGYYLAEVLYRFTDDSDPHTDLYDLAVQAIQRIDGDRDHLMALIHFEVRALKILGHAPATSNCVACGVSVDRQPQRIAFAHELGGVLCTPCRPRHRNVAMIHQRVLDWIDRLYDLESPPDDVFSNDEYRQLRALLNRYISISMGSRPRTQSMLPTKVSAH